MSGLSLHTNNSNLSLAFEKTLEISYAELEAKINSITKTLKPYFNRILKELIKTNPTNAKIIYDYIIAEQTELNIKDSTKEGKIKTLIWLSSFHGTKSFKDMTKQDILEYLNSLRKSSAMDPSNKWIGTYNGRQIILSKFFRWLYFPDEDYKKRPLPSCMQGIRRLPRKEKTAYKPSDIWGSKEHRVFLRYCPFKRDKCYHALANDMSARPHEILNLKIKDIKFYMTDKGIQYAEARITQGKTGPRTVPLIDSIPYLKEWLEEHPSGKNPDSYIFISQGNNHGTNLTVDGLASHYKYYKVKYFPKLLEDKTISDRDKSIIRNMLTKPWNLYVFRHSALTEKSLILSESALKDHAGWTMSSKMTQVYIHLSGESSKVLLQKKGIIGKEDEETSNILKSKTCSHCNEPNNPDSKFCIKCRMVLTFDAYFETLEDKKRKEQMFVELEEKYRKDMSQLREDIESKLEMIMSKIDISRINN